MPRFRLSLAPVAAASALAAALVPVESLACSYPYPGVNLVRMPNFGGPVPTNASIYLLILLDDQGSYTAPGLALTEAGDGLPIPLEIEEIGGQGALYWLIHPEGGFLPETDYRLAVYWSETSDALYSEEVFTTASGPDTLPLEVAPEVVDEGVFYRAQLRDPCGQRESASFVSVEVGRPWDLGADLNEVEVALAPDFSDASFSLHPADYASVDHPGLNRGDRYYVRARVVDLAGQVGPWSEVREGRIPLCALAEDGPSGALALVLMGLAGAWAGRPRRRSSP